MRALRSFLAEIISLFLDDEFLAVTTLILVGLIAGFVKAFGVVSPIAGLLLLLGSVTILFVSVFRAAAANRFSLPTM
jgi:hypothetical protein